MQTCKSFFKRCVYFPALTRNESVSLSWSDEVFSLHSVDFLTKLLYVAVWQSGDCHGGDPEIRTLVTAMCFEIFAFDFHMISF
jgi:hypothetical protein